MVIGFIALGAVGSALNLVTIPWLKFDRQVQMERDIVTKTYDADNALYNYHWFKERHEEILATEVKIRNSKGSIESFEQSAGDRNTWTFEDKTEYNRLNAVHLGLLNYYETIVGEYNARAKSVDRAIFQDELPTFFSLKPF